MLRARDEQAKWCTASLLYTLNMPSPLILSIFMPLQLFNAYYDTMQQIRGQFVVFMGGCSGNTKRRLCLCNDTRCSRAALSDVHRCRCRRHIYTESLVCIQSIFHSCIFLFNISDNLIEHLRDFAFYILCFWPIEN